jgi:hypothetical protein
MVVINPRQIELSDWLLDSPLASIRHFQEWKPKWVLGKTSSSRGTAAMTLIATTIVDVLLILFTRHVPKDTRGIPKLPGDALPIVLTHPSSGGSMRMGGMHHITFISGYGMLPRDTMSSPSARKDARPAAWSPVLLSDLATQLAHFSED